MKKILIVEDDMIINMVNTMYVKKFGYEVSGNAKSGQEAIELAFKHRPDVILMDIKIKGEIDGIETMIEISKFCDAKVIYVTGNSEEQLRKRAAATNILGFCVKPMSMEELKALLEKA